MWIWQKNSWPNFKYDQDLVKSLEEKLLHHSGLFFGAYLHLDDDEKRQIKIQLISNEAMKTSEIEGEFLDRYSLQSSICKHFGLKADTTKIKPKESGIADLMVDLYKNYDEDLTHEMLYRWHTMVMRGRGDIEIGSYRNTEEPMQIVSGPPFDLQIHYEAPPSERILNEMNSYIEWFNSENDLGPLAKASIAHLYFELIHPFEDGNGRIGRALAEKVLAEYFGKPTLIAISTSIVEDKKNYYLALEDVKDAKDITDWVLYFSEVILDALESTQEEIEFLIAKGKLFDKIQNKLNERQEKALTRMFREGPKGFKGGLSAENYISITKATRPTATRDLAKLVDMGVLVKKGELKHTRYFIKFG